jgi:hypothetical protein
VKSWSVHCPKVSWYAWHRQWVHTGCQVGASVVLVHADVAWLVLVVTVCSVAHSEGVRSALMESFKVEPRERWQ